MDETLPDAPNLSPGETLFRRYRLDRKLGQGGMGVVWLVRDLALDRLAALKLLPGIVQRDADAIRDLRDETRRCLDLTHPHIVRIYDFEEDEHTAGISMEFVDGGSLAAVRSARIDRVFEPQELQAWVRHLCDALHYAHTEARIVHRDLKPANLLLNSRGQLKITDFGIARTITDSVTRVTGGAETSGTLLYMSPQQLRGKPGTPADDIYSLGATLYDLLTGRPPFFTGSIPLQVQEVVPPSIAERRRELGSEGGVVPPEWEAAIAACLSKDPASRPRDVLEVARQLSPEATHKPAGTPPPISPSPTPSAPPPLPQSHPSNRAFPWLAATSLALVAAGALLWFNRNPPSAESASGAGTPRPATPEVAPPQGGWLVLNTIPNGARVIIEGAPAGNTPLARKDLSPGQYRVRIDLAGYQPQELVITVVSGQSTDPGVLHLVPIRTAQPTPVIVREVVPVPVPAATPQPAPSANYAGIFPDSSRRKLTRAELIRLSKEELWRARNEIYARNGLIFSSERGRAFARSLGSSYRGTDPDQVRVYQRMNPIEQANVELIKSLE